MSRQSIAAVAALMLGGSVGHAAAPVLAPLFPAGAARGQTITLTVSGTINHWPMRGWADGRGIEIKVGREKGKVSIAVASDAEPGMHWVRLADNEGATNLRPFFVGTLPELVEAEPNDDPGKPQRLDASSTINGRLGKRGDVDGFSIPLRKGQTLVADVEANRHLTSPMDAVLQVVSAEGFVLAQNDDCVGFDPRIVFEAPREATYIVRLFAFPTTPDSTIGFAGGDAYIYRLTMTTSGFLDHTFPLTARSANSSRVEAVGWNIPEPARFLDVAVGEGPSRVSHPLLSGAFEVPRVALATAEEREPNDPAHAQSIPAPVVLSGRIDAPGDRDSFRFGLNKGIKYVVRVESRALGLPLDPVVRLTDAAGKTVAESDDLGKNPDPELAFTPPAEGDFVATVRDLNGRGGPRFAYRLSVLMPEPDFDLSPAADRFEVATGKPASVAVTVNRKDGFAGAIEVVAEGLPAGVTASPVVSKSGDASAKSISLKLSVEDCACAGPFRIIGRATDGARRIHAALAPNPGFAEKIEYFWLTIRPEAVDEKGKK